MSREPIIFELRDIDADVVSAWDKYFKGIDHVRISHGDIFEISADAIVSPANSFGYMDGGIDLVYLRRFGWELQTRLRAHLRDEHDGELPVGQATIVVDHAITKDHGEKINRVTAIYKQSTRMQQKRAVLDGVGAELRPIIDRPLKHENARLAA